MHLKALFTTSLTLLVACGALTAHAAGPRLAFPDGGAALPPAVVDQLRFLHGRGCRALGLTPLERRAVERAVERIDRAMADPNLASILLDKDDWRAEGEHGWSEDATLGAQLVDTWSAETPSAPVSVIAYGPAGDGRCEDEADPSVHALTPLGAPVILLNARYLERRVHAPNGEAGLRDLTRTIAHELTHALGFAHQDDPGAVGLATYNNTAPTFFGCAAASWPDLGYIRGQCGLADYARAPGATGLPCETALELAELVPGAPVGVRFSGRWIDARVRTIDPVHERVEIDFGLAEIGATWVDGCRVRRPESVSAPDSRAASAR